MSEAAPTGSSVGTVSFTDADLPGDTLSASITTGNSDGVFGIDNDGNLTVANNSNLDYETTSAYILTVEVFDGVHASSQSITVDVTNENDIAPVLTANSITISEGQWITLDSGNLAATDVDSDDAALVFDLSNVIGGQFYLGVTGPVPTTSFTQSEIATQQVSFQHDDGEAAPSFDITVSDESLSSGPFAGSVSFTSVNDQPPIIPAGQSFSVSETAATGTSVGTVSFTDADLPGDTLSASITAGNSDGVFGIDNAGSLTVADDTNLDYETTSSYVLTIEVFDGVHTTGESVVIDVTDVSETKFFVVDNSSDSTFEYQANGVLTDSYFLTSGNNAPRGAAADASGTMIWVIDNDDYIYVYDAEGSSQGQWKASGLSRPEGIATDGTDIWIVDRGSDKVFRFNGGAGLTSGTHSADSSFSLGSGNKAPMGITTDGVNLWVVNNKKNVDKVFKYSVAGSLVGSWSIDSQNKTPEGITIDPNNVDSIWIADRGTDQVFEYYGGANRTSASQHADTVFNLSASNGDARGIADPPPLKSQVGVVSVLEDPSNIRMELLDVDAHRDALFHGHEWKINELRHLNPLRGNSVQWVRDLIVSIRDEHHVGKVSDAKAGAIDNLFANWSSRFDGPA